MNLLFFVILIIIIASASSNTKNKNKSETCKITFHYTPSYNPNNYQNKSTGKLNFYSKSERVDLFGYKISNSIFYTANNISDLPFAISIKSKPNFNNTLQESLGYWPNYNRLSSAQQGYYIKWLSEGKPNNCELGYAYLYYYGLEYRALIEKKDLKDILFETIELVQKFDRLNYGYDLIAYLTLSINDFSEADFDKLQNFYRNYSWQYQHNPAYTTIMKKIMPSYKIEFSPSNLLQNNENYGLSDRKRELLSYYYKKIIEQFSELDIYEIKTQKYIYHMAMYHFYGNINAVSYDAIVPSKKIKRLWNNARKIIKNEINQTVKKFDSSAETLNENEILSYLPEKLRKNIAIPMNSFFSFDDKAIMAVEEIAQKLEFKFQDKLTVRQSTMIADACEAFGYEIEPNVKIDNKNYKKDSLVIIYKSQNSLKLNAETYLMAALFTDLGFSVALGDNELLPTEINCIDNFIKKSFSLSPSEKFRLRMRKELIIQTKSINTTDILKKLIKMSDDTEKEIISKFLISVAMADGIVKDSEIKILQKIFTFFNLSENYLNSTLNELINNTDEVVIVEEAKTTIKKGSKIPKNIEADEKIELKLNTAKLNKIKLNTSEIHSILQEIFADEQTEIIKNEPVDNEESTADKGIEIRNDLQSLIFKIIDKNNWTRNELLNCIQSKGVMLSSAIDEINEWSENQYGDFLVEENDDLYIINEDVVKLIKNKG